MGRKLRRSCQLFALVLPALVVTACGSSLMPKGPAGPPTVAPGQPFLSAVQATVSLDRPNATQLVLQPGDNAPIRAKDQINTEGTGRAFLEFPQGLEIEQVRSSHSAIDDVHGGGTAPLALSLRQIAGHTFTIVGPLQKTQITVTTDYATTTPLTDNAQFLVCHVPGTMTCVVAVNGQTQVQAHNQSVTLTAGHGTFVTPNGAPHAPFCTDLNQVRDWWSKMRATGDASDLGSMVVAWMQNPCPAPGSVGTAASPTPAAGAQAALPTPVASLTPAASPTTAASATTAPSATPTFSSTPTASPLPTARPTTPVATASPAPSATPAAPATTAPAPTPTTGYALPSRDGMVKIPAGSYTLGSSTTDDNHVATQHMALPAFWIDKYEVTNAQYKAFLSATGRAAPAAWRGGAIPAGKTGHPALGLTWNDAAAYCTWANKRLPGEAEWEVAGRGPAPDPPLYPWGADPTDGGQAFNLPQDGTYEVGTLAFNHSPFGVYDLIGTVWQWVGQPYAAVPPGTQILRGGRYGLLEDLAYRQPAPPEEERFTRVAGVRCAADHVAGE